MELEIKKKACLPARQGFTLIETIVTLAIFSALVLTITGIAISVIKGQRKAFVLQNTQETGRHILEIVSREIRMSVLNMGGVGLSSSLNIKNAYEENIMYRFEDNKLQRSCSSCADSGWQDLNTEKVYITGGFYIRKSEVPLPPYSSVTLVLRLMSNEPKTEQQTEINLQNTLSLRSYEVL